MRGNDHRAEFLRKFDSRSADNIVVNRRNHTIFLSGAVLLALGVTTIGVTFIPTTRPVSWWIALPLIVLGAVISGRRSTPAGIRRDDRGVLLSPTGHFLFAAELLLPPLALIPVAMFIPAKGGFPHSWLQRLQRLITMFVGSLVFWHVVDMKSGLMDETNVYRTMLAVLCAMVVHLMTEALFVSTQLSSSNGDRISRSVMWRPRSASRDVWELAIGAVAALLAFQHPMFVILAVPLCCLASEHIRLQGQSRLALTDARTGLLNPRGFDEVAAHEWERAEREENRISLILVDLDLLRDVNNTHGHRAGDAVISAVGRLLTASSRSSDAVARLGGEEFAILLPEADTEVATLVAERLRETIAASRIATPVGPLSVTVSCGVATRVGTETVEAMFDRADTALYQAKNAGRNRVAVACRESDDTRLGRRDNAA